MSAREWKPGDVAMSHVEGFDPRVAMRVDFKNKQWIDADGDPLSDPDGGTTFRPLVVLDPENDDQVDGFCKALVEAMHRAGDVAGAAHGIHPATVAAALRAHIEEAR